MKARFVFALAGSSLFAACATNPSQNAAIDSAQSAYRVAAADPRVTRAAAVELSEAGKELHLAEAAWREGATPDVVNHLAYLAQQKALIASERGVQAEAQYIIDNAGAERERAILERRNNALTREAEAHRQALEQQQEEMQRKQLQQQQALAQERQRLEEAQRAARAASGAAETQSGRVAQLQKELQELKAHKTPTGMVITLGNVLFDSGKATLKPGAERNLDRLTRFLERHPERKLRVEGFTDNKGNAETNQDLSRQRAEAVRDKLTQRGIAADRIAAVGYGSAFPQASNRTAAGRQQNRRVEIVISDETGNIPAR